MEVFGSYRLELHWQFVDKNKDSVCCLKGAYLSGPVIKHAEMVQSNDSIVLDFTPQYASVISNYYFVRFEWGKVEYIDDIVKLYDVFLIGDFVNSVSNLSNSDYIIIDTSKHDGERHLYNLVYKAIVVDKNGEEYKCLK